LGRVIPSASLVVGELVASSMIHAGSDIDLAVAWNLGALRLVVRDHGPDMAHQRHSHLDLSRRPLPVVAGLSRAFGVLPTTERRQGRLGRSQGPAATPTDSRPAARHPLDYDVMIRPGSRLVSTVAQCELAL
jgi:hypothetical protein